MLTNDLVAQYLGECHLRGLACSTTEQYRWALTRLITHFPTQPRDGFDLLPVLGDNNLAPESRRDLLKCLRTFFAWCGRRYQLPNPCIGLEPIVRRRQLPRILSRREVERLMAAALIERDRALLLVILDCGLRVGEVAGLMRNHIRDGWLVVDGKVGTRRVPVSDELCDTLMVLGDGEHIWTGKKDPLTRNGVVQAYQRMFGRAGITGPNLDFAHFKRHDRGDLQVDDAERPGVPEYLGQLRTVKNLPTPATDVAAPERWQPLLFSDFVQSPANRVLEKEVDCG